MYHPFDELIIYLRVAQAYEKRLQMSDRDRALVMAGACAGAMKMWSLANFCQRLVLENNSAHMLKKYESYRSALDAGDFGVFLKQVRRKLPPNHAESQLIALNYNCDVQRSDYETHFEFAAAVLGVDAKWLDENFCNV